MMCIKLIDIYIYMGKLSVVFITSHFFVHGASFHKNVLQNLHRH